MAVMAGCSARMLDADPEAISPTAARSRQWVPEVEPIGSGSGMRNP
jgi:hypothetical protein